MSIIVTLFLSYAILSVKLPKIAVLAKVEINTFFIRAITLRTLT